MIFQIFNKTGVFFLIKIAALGKIGVFTTDFAPLTEIKLGVFLISVITVLSPKLSTRVIRTGTFFLL